MASVAWRPGAMMISGLAAAHFANQSWTIALLAMEYTLYVERCRIRGSQTPLSFWDKLGQQFLHLPGPDHVYFA